MDIVAIMKERHSVRQYKNQAIDHSKREEINAFVNAVNAESKLVMQASCRIDQQYFEIKQVRKTDNHTGTAGAGVIVCFPMQ